LKNFVKNKKGIIKVKKGITVTIVSNRTNDIAVETSLIIKKIKKQ
jgi:hypothetical protein